MRSLSLVALLALALTACGQRSDTAGAQIHDPTLGIDENSVCADPAWYCDYIGADRMVAALGTCSSYTTSTFPPTANETVTCTGPGTWTIQRSSYIPPENIGGLPCVQTYLGSYTWQETVSNEWGLCKVGTQVDQVLFRGTYHDLYEDHFVHTTDCDSGWVQCHMARWYEDTCPSMCYLLCCGASDACGHVCEPSDGCHQCYPPG